MSAKEILLFLLINLSHHLCIGQINPLDSCGLDASPFLNQYETAIVDSLFFPPLQKQKTKTPDNRSTYDFTHKKIGFYSCTRNTNRNGIGLLSKKDFFALCKPDFNGHAGRGIITFNEKQKMASNGYDAVLIIDCPYAPVPKQDLILKLAMKNN